MRNRPLLCAAAVVGLALTACPASAQINYQWASDTGTFPAVTSASVPQGGTLRLRVYLLEGPPATNINAAGLVSSGARAIFATPSQASAVPLPATIANGGPWSNGGIGVPATDGTATAANSAVFSVQSFIGPQNADSAGRILLGFFTFSGLAGGSQAVTLRDPNLAQADNTSSPTAGLDSLISNGTTGAPLTLTVTAVPEPGTLMLCGLATVGFAALRRRNRKTAVVETEAVQA